MGKLIYDKLWRNLETEAFREWWFAGHLEPDTDCDRYWNNKFHALQGWLAGGGR